MYDLGQDWEDSFVFSAMIQCTLDSGQADDTGSYILEAIQRSTRYINRLLSLDLTELFAFTRRLSN